jgi:murein DD-endopeptidase MepM/ murein hydrolase activator NlpD
VVPSRKSLTLRALVAPVVALAVIATGAVVPTPASADSLDSIKSAQKANGNKIDDTEQALEGAKKRIRKAVTAATIAQRKFENAQRERKSAQREARRSAAVADQLQREAAYAASDYALGIRAKDRIQKKLNSQRNDMDSVARAVYQQGPINELDVIFNTNSPADFTANLVAVDYISRQQQNVETAIMVTQAEVNMQEVRLKELSSKASVASDRARVQLRKAEQALAKATAKQREVVKLRAAKKLALKKARQYAGQVKLRYERLKKEERRLQAAAKKAVAAAKKAAAEAKAKAQAQAQAQSQGQNSTGDLTWPVPGYSKSGNVGSRIHPIYGYNSCHTGIDIGAPSGLSVKAAESGTVATISRGGIYGNAVLLVHSGGLTTFYAHLSSSSVQIGQSVGAGEQVGLVGSTGWSTGPHLHFETRINGTPYDPMGWFGGPRVPVGCAS